MTTSPLRQFASPNVVIALVEPRIPQNTGNIARLCAAVGVPLYLLGELGFELADKGVNRAGMDYLDEVAPIHCPDPSSFFKNHQSHTPYLLTTKAPKTIWETQIDAPAVLLFGREDAGLPQRLLDAHPEQQVGLPMVPGPRSLNLSNAVAIILYEAWRQHNTIGVKN